MNRKISRKLFSIFMLMTLLITSGIFSIVSNAAKEQKIEITSFDVNTLEFKAVRKWGNTEESATKALRNNIKTYCSNINKAADKGKDEADIGWAGKIISALKDKNKQADINKLNASIDLGNTGVLKINSLDSKHFIEAIPKMLTYGTLNGASYEINTVQSSKALEQINLKYTEAERDKLIKDNSAFAYMINPVVGKVDADLMTDIKSGNVGITAKNKLKINNTYKTEYNNIKEDLKSKDTVTILKVNDGPKNEYKLFGESVKARATLIDTLVPLVYPTYRIDGDNYTMYTEGRGAVNGGVFKHGSSEVYFQIGVNKFFAKSSKGRKEIPGIAKNITADTIALCKYKDKNGVVTTGAMTIKMYEAIRYKNEEDEDKVGLTGRKLAFKATFDRTKKSSGISYESGGDKVAPKWFISKDGLDCTFDEKVGPTVVLNKKYAGEAGLDEWLKAHGDKASSLGSNIDELLNAIQNYITVNVKDKFSWFDLRRFNEIKHELEQSEYTSLMHIVSVIAIIGGIIIIVYSTFMLVAFYIDIVNPFTNVSLYTFMTKGKVMPLPTEEDVRSMGRDENGVKYISHRGAWINMIIGILIGILLFNTRNIFIMIRALFTWIIELFE